MLVNDNVPTLFLNGNMINHTVEFFESQSYISRPSEILLHQKLVIRDGDVGDRLLTEARVSILESEFRNDYEVLYIHVYMYICDRLQENQAQRGTLRKIFFCTYRVVGIQILSSPSFIVVA